VLEVQVLFSLVGALQKPLSKRLSVSTPRKNLPLKSSRFIMFLTDLFEFHLKFLLPEFFLATAILTILLYGSIYSVSQTDNYPLIGLSSCWCSLLVLINTSFLVLFTKDASLVLLNGAFISDTLSQKTKIFVLLGSVVCLLINLSYTRKYKVNSFEYFLIFLLAVFGLMMLCGSFDLIAVYLSIELQSLGLYVLAAFKRESAYSTEAGLKYFILGAFSSGLLLLGISIIYGFTGTTSFEDLQLLFSVGSDDTPHAIQVGIILISSALLFKISAAPFHLWSPDVYDGAPLSSTVFFALVPKIAFLAVFLRVLFFCFGAQPSFWQYFLAFCSLASIVVGSFFALKQRKLKRLLAYSSIGHVGYALLAVASGCLEGMRSSLLYILIYMLMSSGVWSFVSCLNTFHTSSRPRTLADLATVTQSNPTFTFSLAILLFSMAGIPPLAGFFTKLSIFLVSVNASFILYSVLAVLVSVISTFYYLRLIKTVYFENFATTVIYVPITKVTSLVISFSSFFTIFFFINPGLLSLLVYDMVLCTTL
jgi:NADH-quinone oxidoreductase subunit N